MGRKASIPGKLTALAVARTKRAGFYGDGGGLYLQVVASGARSWIFRYQLHGKRREMGLGSLAAVSLANARERAGQARADLVNGLDPIEERDRRKRAVRAAAADTFEQMARDFIAVKSPGWKNQKHGAQWLATLEQYAFPHVGALAVQAIDVHHVLQVLKPIWRNKRETARRVRGRIESILDYATAAGRRVGDNPARLSLLKHLLPEQGGKVRHHPAMPYAEVAPFIAALRKQPGISPMALEFTILTAARTSEVIGATCGEFDLVEKIWTVPAERIKAGRVHRVPLSPRALALVKECYQADPDAWLFPGWKHGKSLSNAALSSVLDRMDLKGITVHGFRSTFRDWVREQTSYPREVAEAALAHVVGDKTEAAYARGDVLEKRRRLMNEWARYCETPRAAGGEVVSIKRKRLGQQKVTQSN